MMDFIFQALRLKGAWSDWGTRGGWSFQKLPLHWLCVAKQGFFTNFLGVWWRDWLEPEELWVLRKKAIHVIINPSHVHTLHQFLTVFSNRLRLFHQMGSKLVQQTNGGIRESCVAGVTDENIGKTRMKRNQFYYCYALFSRGLWSQM